MGCQMCGEKAANCACTQEEREQYDDLEERVAVLEKRVSKWERWEERKKLQELNKRKDE